MSKLRKVNVIIEIINFRIFLLNEQNIQINK